MKCLFIFLSVFLLVPASGQDLLSSRQTSPYTYIYKLTDSETRKIFKSGSVTWLEKGGLFHTLVDSFPTWSDYSKSLPPGNYLKVFARRNKIEAEMASILNIVPQIVNNNTDLCLQLYDSTGKITSDAVVKIRGRHIRFDKPVNGFLLRKSNQKGLLEITHGGITSYYNLSRQINNSLIKRAESGLLLETPLKYVWIPVKVIVSVPVRIVASLVSSSYYNPFRSIAYRIRNIFSRRGRNYDYYNNYNRNRNGYFVFNKPKYRPGDTVRFKTFIVNRRGNPGKSDLNVYLDNYNGDDINLGKIKSRVPGSYSFDFILSDTLDLDLDEEYGISLRRGPENIKSSGRFNYEDYELKNIALKVTTDSEDQVRGNAFRVHIRGTDENDLNIMDGRLEIAILCKDVKRIFKDKVFIPDTLLWQKMKLEQAGETVFSIPDSVFPEANLTYSLKVTLLRSDNEYKSFDKSISFYDRLSDIAYDLAGDSITFVLKENGKKASAAAVISGRDQFGNVHGRKNIRLPYSERINPYYESYTIATRDITRTLSVNAGLSSVNCVSGVSNDSLTIKIGNPRNLQFTWFLYRANHLLRKGYGNEFYFKEKVSRGSRYFLSLAYLWAGKTVSETIDLTGNKNDLNISVNQPSLVYPGEKTRMEIKVTDNAGLPVEGVDLTAFSMTKKFDFRPPVINRFPDRRKSKDLINTFRLNRSELAGNASGRLDFDSWPKASSLDTIEYYKFLYPHNRLYLYSYRPEDGITQFAPFVVKDGEIKKIQVIYVDNSPVFFGWINNENSPYSFRVDSGYHFVEIRTRDKTFRIDSVYFRNSMKLIMSINDVDKPLAFSSEKMNPFFSKQEKLNLGRYLFPYRNNFGENFSWLSQRNRIYMLNAPAFPSGKGAGNKYTYNDQQWNQEVAGPLFSDFTSLKLAGGYSHYFLNEPGYEFEFSSQIIKMRTVDKQKLLPRYLYGNPVDRLSDIPLSEKRILDSYNEYEFKKKLASAKFSIPSITFSWNGKLVIQIDSLYEQQGLSPLFNVLIRDNDPDKSLVYPGNTRMIHDLQPGLYSMVLMFRGEKYVRYDSLTIKPGGRTFFTASKPGKLQNDDFGAKINKIIERKVYSVYSQPSEDFQNYLRQIQRQQSISKYTGDGRFVSGVVNSTEGPVPGVTVIVKGTDTGTITDINGFYSLKVPYGNKELIFSFIGYKSVERIVDSESINVTMSPEVMYLDEVVVVGYGFSGRKSSLASSVTTVQSSLAGRVAGVQVSGTNNQRIMLRGNSSLNAGNAPLFIIDGKPYLGDLSALDPSLIKDIKVLKDESMIALYGARAANGVVIISTSGLNLANSRLVSFLKGAEYDDEFMLAAETSGSIRTNFSDYAYWKPDLVTDKNGIASFDVKFPDDITSWSTWVMAMNGKRQSGEASGSIKSYKPLMAQLYTPRFMIEGDSSNIIGKILNYTPDTLSISSTTEISGRIVETQTRECINAIMDTIPLFAQSADTIKAKYYFTKSNGYLDGEERKIPVFRKGLELSKGDFFILNGDTTIRILNDPSMGGSTVFVQADQLDVMNYEIEGLYSYYYECNEQLASRLKALISQETICKFKGKAFDRKIQVNRIIRLLEKNQNSDGCWGWWDKSETSLWITTHVLEALMRAKASGYNVGIDKQSLTDYLTWRLGSKLNDTDKLDLLYLLSFTDAKINYPAYLPDLAEESFSSLTDKFRLIELRQKLGLKYSVDSVLKYEKKTMFGNIYFGVTEERNPICYNEVETTLSAYRIIRGDSLKDENYIGKIRNFFFEKRRLGRWQNTYETARIIEIIVPDLLKKSGGEIQKQKIELSGSIIMSVEEFPFELKLKPLDSLTIKKTGTFPLYITSYQHYWKTDPVVDSSSFTVDTKFGDNDLSMTAGKPEKMYVSLRVAKDAQYVMVEIPIPGGCSYESKNGYFRGSCHTEFYKDHISIFFENIRSGNYKFEFELLPRYTGKYTLNPAKAELMYFPVFSSNNILKQVTIK